VVMREGIIQQIGTPTEIYNEPANSFVADFIGESNILNGTMIEDCLVEFAGHRFECVDKEFGLNVPVDVVIRPEDIYIFEKLDAAQFTGQVKSCIFKGVHYEMMVTTDKGFEIIVQDYNGFEAGKTVGMIIKPSDIQVMKKERLCNTFEGTIIDKLHVRFLGKTFKCSNIDGFENGTPVKVSIDFKDVVLQDNEEDGMLNGVVCFILYKGNHFHLTVQTEQNENIFVDTNDIWDDRDRVGVSISPESIHIENL
jgi:spermidine/putrescine transport system ATP-binding protein